MRKLLAITIMLALSVILLISCSYTTNYQCKATIFKDDKEELRHWVAIELEKCNGEEYQIEYDYTIYGKNSPYLAVIVTYFNCSEVPIFPSNNAIKLNKKQG